VIILRGFSILSYLQILLMISILLPSPVSQPYREPRTPVHPLSVFHSPNLNTEFTDVPDSQKLIEVSPPASAPAEIQAILDQIQESAYGSHVSHLASAFDTRIYGSEGNDEAVSWIARFFENQAGLEVTFHDFGSGGPNVIATLPGGSVLNNDCIIVGAHLDSIPRESDGADDNASGVAAVLEIARAMSQFRYNHTIMFVAFNSEEQGLIGSSALAGKLAQESVSMALMVNFDMIMWNNPQAPSNHKIDIVHKGGDSQQIAELAALLGHNYLSAPVQAKLAPSWTMSDHSPFWNLGVPAIWFFEYGGLQNPYIHSIQDTITQPDYSYSLGTIATKTAAATIADVATVVSTQDGFPSGIFVSPNSSEFILPSEHVPIILQINDNLNDVTRVELSINDESWIDITSSFNGTHCNYDWNATGAYGQIKLRAQIYDGAGWVNTVYGTAKVDQGILCSIFAPTPSEQIPQGSQYTIWINASDYDGKPIPYVQVRINNTEWLVTRIAVPNQLYYHNWTPTGWGDVSIEARVTDANGRRNSSLVTAEISRYPPMISGVSFTPRLPSEIDNVEITATIFQDSRGSGISLALVYFSVNYELWATRRMTLLSGDVYKATLDPLPIGAQVRFYIEVRDNLGNIAHDDNFGTYYSYTVSLNPTPLLLIGGVSAIAVIGLIGIFLWRRKNKVSVTPSS
jgi:hypothetical protein